MKIIAQISEKRFIAEFHVEEIQKFMNTYYQPRNDLKVSDEIDLGKGYDHACAIRESLTKMEGVVNDVEKITSAVKVGKAVKKAADKLKIKEVTK